MTLAQVRKITQEYAHRYGEIDAQALGAVRDTRIRVVPCPGHRADPKSWVHKTMPLRGTARIKKRL